MWRGDGKGSGTLQRPPNNICMRRQDAFHTGSKQTRNLTIVVCLPVRLADLGFASFFILNPILSNGGLDQWRCTDWTDHKKDNGFLKGGTLKCRFKCIAAAALAKNQRFGRFGN